MGLSGYKSIVKSGKICNPTELEQEFQFLPEIENLILLSGILPDSSCREIKVLSLITPFRLDSKLKRIDGRIKWEGGRVMLWFRIRKAYLVFSPALPYFLPQSSLDGVWRTSGWWTRWRAWGNGIPGADRETWHLFLLPCLMYVFHRVVPELYPFTINWSSTK